MRLTPVDITGCPPYNDYTKYFLQYTEHMFPPDSSNLFSWLSFAWTPDSLPTQPLAFLDTFIVALTPFLRHPPWWPLHAADPFVRQEPPTPSNKPPGRLKGMMMGTASSVSHPRGSLFDDDVGPEQEEPLGTFPPSITRIVSDSGSLQRVVSPPPQSRVAVSRDAIPRCRLWVFRQS